MSNTGNRFLNGTEFTNITVIANCDNTDDGSIEASGTLFVNTIKEYDISSPGVILEDSIFASGKAIITSTEAALNSSTAALIINGGVSVLKDSRHYGYLYVNNTTDSNNLGTGSFIVDGGSTIYKNLNVGGITTLRSSTNSIDSSHGALITPGGISIQNTTDAVSFTSGGALTVSGGASIEKTLFANLLNTSFSTLGNSYLGNASINNLYSPNAYIQNVTSSNILSNALTTGYLTVTYLDGDFASFSNLNTTFGTLGNILVTSQNVINATITNLYNSTANITNILATQGNIDSLTVNNLYVNTNFEYNNIVTNLSTSNINSQFVTIGNLLLENGTYSNLYGTNLFSTNITVPNLVSTHISTSNISSYNSLSVYTTSGNSLINNTTINNALLTNVTATNIKTTNIESLYSTSGYLNLVGTIPSFNSSTGTLISYGGISIDVIENATSITSGGGLTVAGGVSVAKDVYIGYTLYVPNISSSNVSSMYGTISHLSGTNLNYTNSTFNNLYLTDITPSFNSTTASTILNGGISIQATTNAVSATSGGGATILGGLGVDKDVYIGGNTWISGNLDLNSQLITNVTAPSVDLDVANKYYVDNRFSQLTIGNVSGNFTQGQVIIATTGGNITGYSEFQYDINEGSLYIYSTNNATSVSQGGSLQVSGGASVDRNFYVGGDAHILGVLDMNNQKITSVAIPTTYYDAANKYYVDNRFDEFTVGNVSGNFTQGQVIVATTQGNITGYDTFTFFNNTLSVFTTNEATSLTSGGVLNVEGGARIAKSLYVGGPILQIPTGDTLSRPANALPGTVRYNSQTQQFEGYGAGNNWGSLGGVIDIAQTTKILASATPSTTDGNLYFYTVGNERLRINSAGNVGIGTTAPSSTLTINGDLLVTSGINGGGQLITNVTAPSVDLDVANKWYVDNRFNQFTVGNVNGNFTQGQVIIASTDGNITGFNTFTFLDNTLSILTTNNATSLTSGGVLNVEGGTRIAKTLYVGDGINANGQLITNVTAPSFDLDVVNKWYVDNRFNQFTVGNVNGNFTQGQVIIASTDGNITGFNTFTFLDDTLSILTTNNATSLTSGGVLNVNGGTRIAKTLYVGDGINANGQLITNVTAPSFDLDVVNKWYLNERFNQFTVGNVNGNFTQGQVIIASTDGNITGFNTFTFLNDTLSILTTNNATSLTSGGVLSVEGGARIAKSLYVGDGINANGQLITNVTAPSVDLDVVNKWYLNHRLSQITAGNLSGDFTQGQVLVASTQGNVTGFNTFTFIDNTLSILTTNNATSLTSGGVLSVEGGARIAKDVYIGGELDVNLNNIRNVKAPVLAHDAVNKCYVDSKIENIFDENGLFYEKSYTLNNNINTPSNINGFTIPYTSKSFIAYVYVKTPITSSIYTLTGLKSNVWEMHSRFIGGNTESVKFYINDTGTKLNIQYTNQNLSGLCTISYKLSNLINDIENDCNTALTKQVNLTLNANVNVPTSIYSFANNLNAIKLIIYVSSEIDTKYGLVFVHAVKENSIWRLNTSFIGNLNNIIKFYILGNNLQYTNSSGALDWSIRLQQLDVNDELIEYTLNANYTNVIEELELTDNLYFTVLAYVYISSLNKYAFYEIDGVLVNNNWNINTKFIGDNLGIVFRLTSNCKLTYTNPNNVDAFMKLMNINVFKVLPVVKGGTGKGYLNEYSILRGNGINKIIDKTDLIYKENTLSILTTDNATNLSSGGVLNIEGGVRIAKDVYIGGKLDVNLNNITNVQDPIRDYDAVNKRYLEQEIDKSSTLIDAEDNFFKYTCDLSNNVNTPRNVPGFSIPYTSKAFIAHIYVKTETYSSVYTLRGLKGVGWQMNSNFIGGNTSNVNFHVNDTGYKLNIQYTNKALTGLTTISYKISDLIELEESLKQIHIPLNGNVSIPTNITELSFQNATTNAIKLFIYISSDTDMKYGLVMLNAVRKDNIWQLNSTFMGNVDTVKFSIDSLISSGQIKYTNSSSALDYNLRVKQFIIDDEPKEYVLTANTNNTIERLEYLFKEYLNRYILVLAYVYIPTLNKYTCYEIESLNINNTWLVNTRFIGDNIGISFSVTHLNTFNYLSYNNPNNVDAYVRFVNIYHPIALPVIKGGTSTTYLNEYSILRGNGIDKVLATEDLIYKDNQLIMGNMSSIILNSTQNAINLTSGTLVTLGGISVNKDVRIGGELIVNNVLITPLSDDILSELVFYGMNNQLSPQNINGFMFGASTKSFKAMVCITITTLTDSIESLFEIKGLKKSSGWIINTSFIGDNTGIDFSINNTGQVQYTSSNINDWTSNTMKIRAITTSA